MRSGFLPPRRCSGPVSCTLLLLRSPSSLPSFLPLPARGAVRRSHQLVAAGRRAYGGGVRQKTTSWTCTRNNEYEVMEDRANRLEHKLDPERESGHTRPSSFFNRRYICTGSLRKAESASQSPAAARTAVACRTLRLLVLAPLLRRRLCPREGKVGPVVAAGSHRARPDVVAGSSWLLLFATIHLTARSEMWALPSSPSSHEPRASPVR